MSLSWTHQIAKSLASGRPSPALELHLDALLVWLSNPDNPRAAALERAIKQQGLPRIQASASAYRLLDQQLFVSDEPPAPEVLGFAPSLAAPIAKQRYRRLMQAYHPDRHPERTRWATRRTEQINRAFAAREQRVPTPTRSTGHKTTAPRAAPRRTSTWRSWRLPPTWLPGRVRDLLAPLWVWGHRRLLALTPRQQRGVELVAIVGAMLLIALLWPVAPPKPVPKIVHHPLGTTPPVAAPAPTPVVRPETTISEAEPAAPAPPRAVVTDADTDPNTNTNTNTNVETTTTAPLAAAPALPPLPELPIENPAPPLPPTAPRTPLAQNTAPDTAPTPTTREIRCQTAPDLLLQFQAAYEDGALDALMELYSPLAQENTLQNWFAIRQAYAEWFNTTGTRRIEFGQIQVQPIADSPRCALMAVFEVRYLDRQAKLNTQTGIIEMLIERRQRTWKILRARY